MDTVIGAQPGSGPRSLDFTNLRLVFRTSDLTITWTTSDLTRPPAGEQWVYSLTFTRGETPYRVHAIMAATSLPGPEISPDRDQFSVIINGGVASGGTSKTITGAFDQSAKRIRLTLKAVDLQQASLRYFGLSHLQTSSEAKINSVSSTSDDLELSQRVFTTGSHAGC